MTFRIIAFLISIFCHFITVGQLPQSAITVFEMREGSIEKPQFLTNFNISGYNNQPAFFDKDILYLTSDWNAQGQTDIIKLNIKAKTLTKVTTTQDSEYSPTPTPDGIGMSCISVPPGQSGDNQIQLLWKYPLDRSNGGKAITYDFENVGYHHWLNRNEVAIFLVGEPHRLIIYNTLNQSITPVDENVGRCFRMNTRGELVYVHKAAHNIWYLKTYNVTTQKKNIIGETKTGSEDFELLGDNSILMGKGSILYQLSDTGGWKSMADLKKYGVDKISRLAIRNNKIAIVHAS